MAALTENTTQERGDEPWAEIAEQALVIGE
jgi:hypothetical protein